MLQTAFLAYFDLVYLQNRGTVKATVYETEKEVSNSVEVELPREASGIKVSADGAYVAYSLDGKLEIFDISNRRGKKTIDMGEDLLFYYGWLPDRDMVIYSRRVTEKGKTAVQISTYDIHSDVERSYPEISGLPSASEVLDIELSPLTNVVYVKVKVSDSKARVYRYDIMDNLMRVMDTGISTVIKETLYNDNLIYQDDKNKIYVRAGKNKAAKQLPFKNKMVLLGVDSEDKVYVGELNKEDRVSRIYFGLLDELLKGSWTEIPLEKPVLPGNILITPKGAVYELAEAEGLLRGIDGSENIAYEGKFIELLDDYVVTRGGKGLKFTTIKTN